MPLMVFLSSHSFSISLSYRYSLFSEWFIYAFSYQFIGTKFSCIHRFHIPSLPAWMKQILVTFTCVLNMNDETTVCKIYNCCHFLRWKTTATDDLHRVRCSYSKNYDALGITDGGLVLVKWCTQNHRHIDCFEFPKVVVASFYFLYISH